MRKGNLPEVGQLLEVELEMCSRGGDDGVLYVFGREVGLSEASGVGIEDVPAGGSVAGGVEGLPCDDLVVRIRRMESEREGTRWKLGAIEE